MGQFKRKLSDLGCTESETSLIDKVIEFAGDNKRQGELFNKGVFGTIASGLKKELGGVSNVYTQHRPLIWTYLNQLKSGKLKESLFPYASGSASKAVPTKVLVYIVGGVTYVFIIL